MVAGLERHGFLAEDVLARRCGLTDQLRVTTGRRRDDDRLDLRIVENGRVVDRSNGDRQRLGPALVEVRARDRLDDGFGHGMDQVLGVHPADAPRADHTHRGLVHVAVYLLDERLLILDSPMMSSQGLERSSIFHN